jgi:peptidyl-prolyl cis-trans isomerase D
MLQTFRKHSGSIFAKILFGLLVASFAFWGIGDMFRSYTAMQPVAKVGRSSISQEEFVDAYKKVVSRLQTASHGKLKPEDVRQLGVEKRVIDDLVDVAVLDNEVRRLGLIVSNSALESFIKSVPAFKNKTGQFDRNQFRYLLTSHELSEAGFIHQSRENLLKQQLIGTLSSGLHLPAKYRELMFHSQEQQKVFSVVYIPATIGQVTEKPKESDLEQLYQTHQETFTRPEYRDVSVLMIDPKKLQEAIKIAPEQIKEEYTTHQSSFMMPELRDVIKITFSSRETAEQAKAELLVGKTVEEVVKKLKGQVHSYSAAGPDKFAAEHAKAIFAQGVNGVTDVLSSAFGSTVFKITKITPAYPRSLEEVKGKIEAELKSQIYSTEMNDLQNKIEDGLAEGTPLKELAQTYNLSDLEFGDVDGGGLNQAGDSVIPADLKEVVLENAFNQEAGIASSLLNLPDGRSVAVLVTKITPKVLPPFAEVKEKVAKTWYQVKQSEAAGKVAQDLAAQVKSPQELANQAQQLNLAVRTLPPINRVELEEGKLMDDRVTSQALRNAFSLPLTQAVVAPVKDGFVVMMPSKTLPLDTKKVKEKQQNFDRAFNSMIQRDFQESYIAALKERNKPEIRQDVINALMAR